MARDWKPGDVAMVQCSDGEWRRAFLTNYYSPGDSWHFENGAKRSTDTSTARPLVVIDPEDREAAEDLIRRWVCTSSGCPDVLDVTPRQIDQMQAALRDLADPKPLKPEEPTGKWAVVKDSSGAQWCHAAYNDSGERWNRIGTGIWTDYCNIDAVEVLSQGVTP